MVRIRLGFLLKRAFIAIVFVTAAYTVFTFYLANPLLPRYLKQNVPLSALPPLMENNDDLIWFVQVTDLHISQFEPRRTEDFSRFCQYLSNVIKPSVFVVSGDITDGKERNSYGSRQYKEEWSSYSEILHKCGILDVTKVFDVRGNHDTFDVLDDSHSNNMFQWFSIQGLNHTRSYSESLSKRGRKITFIAIDPTRMPGLKRPLNFFGILSGRELEEVKQMLQQANESDYTIIFGHYPTSSIITKVRNIFGGQIYMCGHYHLRDLYTRHQSGLLELELADWKEKRLFRIAAFDQGFFSFADVPFSASSTNLAVIVTNPKDPTFLLEKEPLENMRRIQSVRILVFSDSPITDVKLQLPGESVATVMKRVGMLNNEISPLFSSPWNPSSYKRGLHEMKIDVTLENGKTVHRTHKFSLDGTQEKFGFISRFALMVDGQSFSEHLFGLLGCLIVVGLVCLRMFSKSICDAHWCHKFLILSSIGNLIWPLVCSVIWASFFPWAFGYILTGRIAIIFAWGTFLIDDFTYILPDMIPIYGVFAHGLTIIFIFILANSVRATYETHLKHEENGWKVIRNGSPYKVLVKLFLIGLKHHSGFVFVILMEIHNTWALFCSYGFISIVSPCGMGRIALTLWLYNKAHHLDYKNISEIRHALALYSTFHDCCQ